MTETILTVLEVLAFALACACAVFAWAFVWMYRRTTWRDSPEGQHLIRFTAAIGTVFTLTVMFAVLPVPPLVRGIVAVVVFGMIARELWRRIALFRAAQRERANR